MHFEGNCGLKTELNYEHNVQLRIAHQFGIGGGGGGGKHSRGLTFQGQ